MPWFPPVVLVSVLGREGGVEPEVPAPPVGLGDVCAVLGIEIMRTIASRIAARDVLVARTCLENLIGFVPSDITQPSPSPALQLSKDSVDKGDPDYQFQVSETCPIQERIEAVVRCVAIV